MWYHPPPLIKGKRGRGGESNLTTRGIMSLFRIYVKHFSKVLGERYTSFTQARGENNCVM
jgi:hypothetical protein